MGDEGQFRFTNGTVIDEFLSKERILDVVNHEFTHSLLYATTSYGQFVMMLEKNGIVDDRSNIIKDALFSYMGRMQERVAVNIELMIRCVSGGVEDYFNAIDSLKMRNNIYYNHFRKMCCVNGKISEQKDAEQLIQILRETARVALNVDLSRIPFEKFNTEKDVVRFFNDPINNARYSPNRRFEILINVFFRDNENNNDIQSVYKGSLNLDRMDNGDDGSVAYQGGWGFCEGPQGYYWGGTWVCAANGTDNPTLVKDVIKTMTTDKKVLKEIAMKDSDCVNSKSVLKDLAGSADGNNKVLGGQNPYATLAAGAEKVDMSNTCPYDQGCNEAFQSAMKDYFTGTAASYDAAVQAFQKAVKEKYPSLTF